ncbi:MAG TPA: phage holin family protein [Bryobacteraceae bacterium]|nr:phage holin family protein [Bryobacteraceae bacterium]
MADKQDRSIGELISELAGETATLVRQEVALAKVEFSQKAGQVGREVASLAIGGALAYAALLCLIAAAISLLAGVMPWWTAALIVGAIVGIVGAMMASKALAALRNINLAPQQTIETLKENAQWVKE